MKRLMRAFHLSVLIAGGALLASCASNRVNTQVSGAVSETANQHSSNAEVTANDASLEDDDYDEYAVADVYDPWEGFNRGVFRINDGIYDVLMRPVAKGYQFILPRQVRKGISNAFFNVKYPVRVVNGTLQGKFKRAGQETGMFVVNTVAGVGGLFKVSQHIPALADVPSEDTGQTFGRWGIGQGPYLVLPVLGPSSFRDTIGYAGDQVLNPLSWGWFSNNIEDWTEIPAYINTVQNFPDQLEIYDVTIENAVDPYIAARSAYLQNRKHAVEK